MIRSEGHVSNRRANLQRPCEKKDEKNKNRDVLAVIYGEWARGRPKRLEGGSQRQGESTKTHGRHSSGQGLILSGVRIPCQTLATFFLASPLAFVKRCCTSEYTPANPFETRAAKFRTSVDSWPWARSPISLCCMITPAPGLSAYIHRQ
jgi:hypothetical protein